MEKNGLFRSNNCFSKITIHFSLCQALNYHTIIIVLSYIWQHCQKKGQLMCWIETQVILTIGSRFVANKKFNKFKCIILMDTNIQFQFNSASCLIVNKLAKLSVNSAKNLFCASLCFTMIHRGDNSARYRQISRNNIHASKVMTRLVRSL